MNLPLRTRLNIMKRLSRQYFRPRYFHGLLLLCLTASCSAERPLLNYYEARDVFWRELYADGGKTLYCTETFGTHHSKNINIEHIFPMGWVMNELQCGDRKTCRRNSNRFNLIEADLHNLYPSNKKINRDRSSYAFGEVKGEKRAFGRCDFEVDRKRRLAEPAEQVRGDVARAMLYMSDRYAIPLFKRQRVLMEKWHKADPADAEEKRRNNVIEMIQGNRNPYIDE